MDLVLVTDTAEMHRWIVGVVPFRHLLAAGQARFIGPSRLAKAFPTWFDTTLFSASLERAGRRRSQDALTA